MDLENVGLGKFKTFFLSYNISEQLGLRKCLNILDFQYGVDWKLKIMLYLHYLRAIRG